MRKMIMIGTLVAVMAMVGFYGVANAGDTTATAGVSGVEATSIIVFPDPPAETTANNNGRGYRGFAEPGNAPIPGAPGYFGPVGAMNQKTPRTQDVSEIISYKDTFTIDEINLMSAGTGFLGTSGSDIIVTPLVVEIDEADRAGAIKVVETKPEGSILKGYVTVRATASGTVSVKLVADAMKAARALGSDAIHVTGEGAEMVLRTLGWGLGASWTQVTMSGSEMSGGSGTGGTGISGGTSGYQDRPWIQLFAIDIPN